MPGNTQDVSNNEVCYHGRIITTVFVFIGLGSGRRHGTSFKLKAKLLVL